MPVGALKQILPAFTGISLSGWILVIRPSSTLTTTPQAQWQKKQFAFLIDACLFIFAPYLFASDPDFCSTIGHTQHMQFSKTTYLLCEEA
jgi:hypothetical protein